MYFFFLLIRRAHYSWYTANTKSRIRIIVTGIFTVGAIVLTYVQCRAMVRQSLQRNIPTEGSSLQGSSLQGSSLSPGDMRIKIKDMMLHAWRGYARVVWGTNEFRPISRRAHVGGDFASYKLGATIIESLDTLHLMGLHNELNRSRNWIEKSFSLDRIDEALSVFELTSRLLCPMLTLYSLTGDSLYMDKAIHIADKILPAFDTPTGIPRQLVVPKAGSTLWKYLSDVSRTAEFGALHLEFYYLSEISGYPVYKDRVDAIRRVLAKTPRPNGLYPNAYCTRYGKWENHNCSVNRLYDTLLKSWIQSGRADTQNADIFKEALLAVAQNLVVINAEDVTYVSTYRNGTLFHRMRHSECFVGGLFALGATETLLKHWEKYVQMSIGLTDTCHDSYWNSPTRLGPDTFAFTEEGQKEIEPLQRNFYNLRPEVAETYFILWRMTHYPKYRSWGLEMVQAIEKYCRKPYGYTGVLDVNNVTAEPDDVQRSFFLGATLKYLYLLFSDDEVVSLAQWVFNSAGHFLPIKGANPMYRPHYSSDEALANHQNI
ncbi:mannosyl-oligosaccharide alpha-1,2-mannosidase IA [Drosophila erecta]|nr:mannosyl-oligosaccharide alpha-1,2-mannosidase IA [Drosophila erecta]EDV53150.2 uncharacterized protein Dere_GG11985 [Drosophila erecta]